MHLLPTTPPDCPNTSSLQMEMVLCFLFLLQLCAVGESVTTDPMNQTDLQVAMSDTRARSYHGFVILLKILNRTPSFVHSGEMITFLLPSDEELSNIAPSEEYLQDFVYSHSIPMALMLSHLLHFPNGTLVPSGVPNRMLGITQIGRSGLSVNNAKILKPNVCSNSRIKCHGISRALSFDRGDSSAELFHLNVLNMKKSTSASIHGKTKRSSYHVKSTPLH